MHGVGRGWGARLGRIDGLQCEGGLTGIIPSALGVIQCCTRRCLALRTQSSLGDQAPRIGDSRLAESGDTIDAADEHISFSTAPLGVSVSVSNGKVTLAGTTSSGSVRKRAEKIAREVASVCHIDNRIVSVPSRGSAF